MTQPPTIWSGRVPQPPERYGYLLQDKHSVYVVVEGNHGYDPSTYDQTMVYGLRDDVKLWKRIWI